MMRCLFLVTFLVPLTLWAGPADEAWNAWLTGDFDLVARIAETSGGNLSLPQAERAKIYLALGCSEAMRNRNEAAGVAFYRALELDSTLRPSQEELPPPAWILFSTASQKFAYRIGQESVEEVLVQHGDKVSTATGYGWQRSSVAKSLIFPGLGHVSRGERRGYWIAGAEACLVGGWILSAAASSSARGEYLKTRDNNELSDKYSKYNTYYRMSWGFGLSAVALYIGAQYDFFTTIPPIRLGVSLEERPTVSLSLTL